VIAMFDFFGTEVRRLKFENEKLKLELKFAKQDISHYKKLWKDSLDAGFKRLEEALENWVPSNQEE